MTLVEALKALQDLQVPTYQESSVKKIAETVVGAYHDGYLRGLAENKYHWHDLRKNPNDLPKPHTRLLFYASDSDYSGARPVRFKEYYSGYLTDNKTFLSDKNGYDFTNREFDIGETIAWGYVEPFEKTTEPTVDAEPIRHGHWNKMDNVWECSECGETISLRRYEENRMNYCPNCGTKMDEVEE